MTAIKIKTISMVQLPPAKSQKNLFHVALTYKNQVHFCAPVFLYNARFEKGNAKHRNSPGDCFGARVRAAERRSEAGESRRSARKAVQDNLYCVYFFCRLYFQLSNTFKHKSFFCAKIFFNKFIITTQPQFDKF